MVIDNRNINRQSSQPENPKLIRLNNEATLRHLI